MTTACAPALTFVPHFLVARFFGTLEQSDHFLEQFLLRGVTLRVEDLVGALALKERL